MYRVFALILAVVGLFSPFGLNAILVCGACPTTESVAACCEAENAETIRCCTDDSCDQDCSGCMCAKRVDPPSFYPRVDRDAEVSTAAALCVAVLLHPIATTESGFGLDRHVNESPPHLGALKTIRLAI